VLIVLFETISVRPPFITTIGGIRDKQFLNICFPINHLILE